MKFSVITVCRNSELFIADCIQSVLSQDYPHIEHIIVDGCSTDSTLSIVDELNNGSFLIASEPDTGIYDAMNKGLAMASGDVVCL